MTVMPITSQDVVELYVEVSFEQSNLSLTHDLIKKMVKRPHNMAMP